MRGILYTAQAILEHLLNSEKFFGFQHKECYNEQKKVPHGLQALSNLRGSSVMMDGFIQKLKTTNIHVIPRITLLQHQHEKSVIPKQKRQPYL